MSRPKISGRNLPTVLQEETLRYMYDKLETRSLELGEHLDQFREHRLGSSTQRSIGAAIILSDLLKMQLVNLLDFKSRTYRISDKGKEVVVRLNDYYGKQVS